MVGVEVPLMIPLEEEVKVLLTTQSLMLLEVMTVLPMLLMLAMDQEMALEMGMTRPMMMAMTMLGIAMTLKHSQLLCHLVKKFFHKKRKEARAGRAMVQQGMTPVGEKEALNLDLRVQGLVHIHNNFESNANKVFLKLQQEI